MAEPKVSYKRLEKSINLFVVSRLVLMATVLLLKCCGSDAASTSASTADEKDVLVRVQRSQTMANDNKSARDITSQDDDYLSLPTTVQVEGDDTCSSDQYLDSSKTCQTCTTCGPGMQHTIDHVKCGYGRGLNQTCEPCPPQYYQDKTSFILVRCQRCITCDSLANTTRECSPEHDAECGPCPPGMYYENENNCISCKEGDSTREECRMTTPITPEPTESTSFPTPVVSDATPSAPADIVATTDQTITTSEGPKRSTTDPTVHGGVDQPVLTGVIVGVAIVGVLAIAALIGVVYLIVKKKHGETRTPVENGTTGGHPGQNCDGVYDIREGEIIPLVAPSQDNSDERQARQSSLPVGPSPVDPSPASPPSACNGPSVSGQDAPPASLPREDDTVYQVEWSEDDQPRSLQSNLSVGPNQVSPPSACSGPSVSGQDAPPASLPREDDTVPLSGERTASPEP